MAKILKLCIADSRFMYDLRTMNVLRFIVHVLSVYDFHIQVHLLSYEA